MASRVVFGCLKHRTIASTIHPEIDKVIWIDTCTNSGILRVHTTESDDDLLNRRSLIVNLDTQNIPICKGTHKNAEESTESSEVDSNGNKRRWCDGDNRRVQLSVSESKKLKLEKEVYFQASGGVNKRVASGCPPFLFSDHEEKVNLVAEYTPTGGERRGRPPAGPRSSRFNQSRRPDRLICQK